MTSSWEVCYVGSLISNEDRTSCDNLTISVLTNWFPVIFWTSAIYFTSDQSQTSSFYSEIVNSFDKKQLRAVFIIQRLTPVSYIK